MFNDIQKVELSSGTQPYYSENTSSVSYVQYTFPEGVNDITVSNDSLTDQLRWSFNGSTLHGEIKSNESKTVNMFEQKSVWIRGVTGGGSFRIFNA